MGLMHLGLAGLLAVAGLAAEDETCEAVEGGLLELHDLLAGESCKAESAVSAIHELWKKSTTMHETHDHLAKVMQQNWTDSCTLCVQKDSCHLDSDTIPCHDNPDLHYLNKKVDGSFSAKNFWDSVKCNTCKYGLMAAGGAIQIAMDATPEAIAEIGVFGVVGQGLRALAAKQGKSLAVVAWDNAAMQGALVGLASTLVTILSHMNLLHGDMDHDEFQSCIVAIELDALPLIISTAGQALIPTVLGALGDLMCCTGNIKDACKKKQPPWIPVPIPPHDPPTTTTTTTGESVVVLYEEALAAGQSRAKSMSEEEREGKTDDEMWKEAVELYGGEEADASAPMFVAAGAKASSCATNKAKKVARTQPEIDEQNAFKRKWDDCRCEWYCSNWKIFPRGPKNLDCYSLALEIWPEQRPLCPGNWWRSLLPEEKCAQQAPQIYNSVLLKGVLPKIVVPPTLGVQAVISFGGRTGQFLRQRLPPRMNADNVGFNRAKYVKKQLPETLRMDPVKGEHLVYIDQVELAGLDGGYFNEQGSVRNCYWASYYKSAMFQSKLMIYLVDEAWLFSKFCAQELFWAIGEDDPTQGPTGWERRKLTATAYEEFPSSPTRHHIFAAIDVNPFGKEAGCRDNEIKLTTIGQCVQLPQNSFITQCGKSETIIDKGGFSAQLKDCVFEQVKTLQQSHGLQFS